MTILDEISDRTWAALAPHLSGKEGDVGRTGADNRLFRNAVLWVARHGCAWRALPARFGQHGTLRKRSRRWTQKGSWQRLSEAVQEPDLDGVMLDSTVVRAHAQAAGSRKKSRGDDEALGRSRGGLTTKIHAVVDALGNPLRVVLGPGQQADCRRVAELLSAAKGASHVLADRAYNTDAVLARVAAMGAQAVIPSKKNRLVQRVINRNLYRDRNKVARFFSRLKQFRRLATRYDKTGSSFLGMVHFVSALLWLR